MFDSDLEYWYLHLKVYDYEILIWQFYVLLNDTAVLEWTTKVLKLQPAVLQGRNVGIKLPAGLGVAVTASRVNSSNLWKWTGRFWFSVKLPWINKHCRQLSAENITPKFNAFENHLTAVTFWCHIIQTYSLQKHDCSCGIWYFWFTLEF